MNTSFIDKLKNRQVWKSFVAYPAASFIILQAVDFFISKYGLNSKMLTLTLILLIGGFFISVLWNWNHGEKGIQKVTRKEQLIYGLITIITVLYASFYWANAEDFNNYSKSQASINFRKLAVLPFENKTNDASFVYLSDGIPENLINHISRLTNLRVLSRNSTFILNESDRNAQGVQKKLDADLMLSGRIEQLDNKLMVNCQLVNVGDGTQIWGDKFLFKNNNVVELEDLITNSLLKSLPSSSRKENQSKQQLKSNNPEVQAHYMKGRALSYGSTSEEAEKALNHFRQAIEIDPKFVPAYVAIANEKIIQAMFSTATRDEIFNESRMAVQTAIALDPEYSEAYVVDGSIKFYGDFNWSEAEASYKKAFDLDSLNVNALIRYSAFLAAMKRYDEALILADKAILLDPISISSLHNLGWVNLLARNFETSELAFSEALDIHPNWIWGYIKRGYTRMFLHKCDLALEDTNKARSLINGRGGDLLESTFIEIYGVCNFDELKYTAITNYLSEVNETNYNDPVAVSFVYLIKDDLDLFFYWMEKSIKEKSPSVYLYGLDLFLSEDIQNNPRFIELKALLNFPSK
ncbi:tetratricopeptide repeat protein [Formosa maritima]|uniref:Uncharacterized protein n=1 Tax=Formosa maritima TaxID=2592046 RepID=A0A5D0GBI6_9FLAO|nr:hypothetical protein [Formosa maritima]TYA56030.1 hypothetical protein FVF61_07040 [Formosa maritima]